MSPVALVLVCSFGVALIATPAVRDLAGALGAMDQARGSRKVHARPVPRLGGLAIAAGVCLGPLAALAIPAVRSAFAQEARALAALGGAAAAVLSLGAYDDVRGASPRLKLLVQFSAAIVLWAAGFRAEALAHPFGPAIELGALSLPVTLLWIAGVSNAVNLIDGLDGLAGGVALAAGVVVAIIGWQQGDVVATLLALALVGAVTGFLAYNVSPASIFMGDTGSLFLGLLLAALPLRGGGGDGARAGVPMLAMVVALGIPIADTCAAIVRRAARGAPLFSADREHIHHRLLDAGLSQAQAVLVLWAGAAMLAAAAVQLATGGADGAAAPLGVLALAVAPLLWRPGAAPPLRERRRRNQERFRAVRDAARQLAAATRLGEVERALQAFAPALDARTITVELDHQSLRPLGPRARFPFTASGAGGAIDVEWARLERGADRDAETALELVAQHAAAAVQRVARPSTDERSRWRDLASTALRVWHAVRARAALVLGGAGSASRAPGQK